MTRAVWGRLAALVAILAVGLSYILFSVLQISIGSSPFQVTLDMPRGGGLFAGGFVAYRGVDVGRVSSLHLTPTGIAARLTIDRGTRIPLDSQAVVHDLSAVGEQYVDLVPKSSSGPYLNGGDVISASAAQEPLQISQVLNDASNFSKSISTIDFSQLLRSLSTALGGTGPQLHTILVAGDSLAQDLGQVKPATDAVIDQGQTLLRTANATNPDVTQFSTNLDNLTRQLEASNADIKDLIANGDKALPQLNRLLSANTSVLQSITTLGTSVLSATSNNNAAVQALLAALPTTLGSLSSVVRDGSIQGIFDYNDEEPVCTYVTDQNVFPEPTAIDSTLTLGRTCTHSAPDLLQRGAAEAPEEP